MKKHREIIAIILAVVLFLLLCFSAAGLLIPFRSEYGVNWSSYVEEESDSIDVLFFGSSMSYCNIVPAVIYEHSGLSSYVVAGPEQTIPISYYYIKEACRTQQPEAIVLELSGMFFEKYQNYTLANISCMPYGLNRLGAIFNAAERQRIPGLLFPILDYHDRWYKTGFDELKKNISPEKDMHAGYTFLSDSVPQEEFSDKNCADEYAYGYAFEYLGKICSFCDENGIELILYLSPAYTRIPDDKMARLSSDLEKLSYTAFIDFNSEPQWSAMNIDSETDWYDSMHFNCFGAEKFSRVMADLILSEGISPSGNDSSSLWQDRYEHFKSLA